MEGAFAIGRLVTRRPSIDSTSTQYRPYVHCHLAYQDTTPNVVWSELQARKSGSTVVYYDWRSRIRHWSPTRGLNTVYQVPAGVADRGRR